MVVKHCKIMAQINVPSKVSGVSPLIMQILDL